MTDAISENEKNTTILLEKQKQLINFLEQNNLKWKMIQTDRFEVEIQ